MKKKENFIDEMSEGILAIESGKNTPTKGVTMKPTTQRTEPLKLTQLQKVGFGSYMINNAMTIKVCVSLLVAFFCTFPMVVQQVYGAERIRVIVDTDIECEMDDQHALAYTLFNSHVFEVEGVTVTGERSWQAKSYANEAKRIVHLCASKVAVYEGAFTTYDKITGNIHKSKFEGHAAVNFIIERAHAQDPSGRPLYVITLGKTTNLALALLKDPTIAPKIKAVCLMTRFPASLNPSANWTVSESNYIWDRYAAEALLENANLELNIVPWQFDSPEVPISGTLNPSLKEIYDSMPGLGPKVAPIAYHNKKRKRTYEGQSFTCFGDYSVALLENREHLMVVVEGNPRDKVLSYRPGFLDVAAPMILKHPSFAVSTVMGAPKWEGTPGWTGSVNEEPGKWILNPDNPRKVTVWNRLYLQHPQVMEDFWNTFRNPVLKTPAVSGGAH